MSKKVTVQMRLPNVMTVGVEKYGLNLTRAKAQNIIILFASVWSAYYNDDIFLKL
jgi:hypothetical protein